jgi:hypothetical protein
MEDDRALFILDASQLDERRQRHIERVLEIAVTTRSLVQNQADGYAYRKQYRWAKGELKIEIVLSHHDGGNDHIDIQLWEIDLLVFHVSGVQRVNQRKKVFINAWVHREIRSYWEVSIHHAEP